MVYSNGIYRVSRRSLYTRILTPFDCMREGWGFARNHIPQKKDWINQSFFCGADDGIRVFEPLAITGLQVVEKISPHSYAPFSSFAQKSDVYNLVLF